MRELLDRRVLLVTGKGGVGKTTVAASLALEAASRGKRVLLVETAGSTQVPGLFGRDRASYDAQRLTDDLYTLSVTPEKAIEDYIVQQIKVRALFKMVFRNRIMGPFMDGVPGLHDLVQLGKVFDLERETSFGRSAWDLIVVDAPATGHGLTMLDAPRSMMELTIAGPFHDNARLVHQLFVDPDKTALVLVALPEEMPVNETLDLYGRLGDYRRQVRACVLNEVHPPPFAELDRWEQARQALDAPALAEAVDCTDRSVLRARRQIEARRRLSALPCPILELSFLYDRRLGLRELERLGRALGAP
jgi:anion-transporting  ArsA/GET3 family ATPase